MIGYALLRWLRHCLGDRERRETARLLLFRPRGLFQPFGTTADDRYPGIFAFVRSVIGDGPDRRLLSFGCSTGDEVFTLRRLFPQAAITGLDISPSRIAFCNSRLRETGGDAGIRFAVAASAENLPAGAFDAVFAMAVFRHGDLRAFPERCDHLIRFAEFDRVVSGLARCLRPGGLLILRFANFRFADSRAAAGFVPLLARSASPETPLYDPDNRLIRDSERTMEDVVFRKRGA